MSWPFETAETWNITVPTYCLISNHHHRPINSPEANVSRSMRHLRPDRLKQTGEQFQMEKNSTVSDGIERLEKKIKTDQKLKDRIKAIINTVLKSQVQTCPLYG